MKYINSKDLMMFLVQPITKLAVFEAETVDAALIMCADAFPKLETEFQVTIDFPTFKYQLLKTMSEFLAKCEDCEHECLRNPRKRMEEERYARSHIVRSVWPVHMQKTNAENFFLMEYTLTYADILYRYLLDAGIAQEIAHPLAQNALQQLAKWIDNNCIKKCHYACIRSSESSGYCTLCSFMIQPLACPKKQEVSYRQLMLNEEDVRCMRGEFKSKKV